MRTSTLFCILIIIGLGELTAQILTPVKWNMHHEKVSDTEFDLFFTAQIEDGWNIYSQHLESDEGPVATSFEFDGSPELVGEVEEIGKSKEGFDPIFEMHVKKLFGNFDFKQRVKISGNETVTGRLIYMTCNDKTCLPPTEVEFSFDLDPSSSSSGGGEEPKKKDDPDLNSGTAANSGILEPVKWEADIVGGDLIFTAKIDNNWQIYSQAITDEGPIPTTFFFGTDRIVFEEHSDYAETSFDQMFEVELTKLKKEVTFRGPVSALNSDTVSVEYMACDPSQCIFPEPVVFYFDKAANHIASVGGESANSEQSFLDITESQDIYALGAVNLDEPVAAACGENLKSASVQSSNLLKITLLGFVGGLLAILTPCVFPMIPLTVSFFTKSGGGKKGLQQASLYGFFILLVYLLLSAPFHFLDSINPNILNEISTNIGLNIFFFVVFVFFAFSFFGYYELTLPSSWSNKASQAEGVGGIIGIFFMALTLALVSFSCTGPILGSLLAGSLTSDGGAMQLTAGMGGFGLALALPFALFAAFPTWLNKLPKSGSWLTTVKVVLGFLELGLAFKFLSTADLVKRWGVLKIEPFLILEIIIFIGLALYLFGFIRFPHDPKKPKVNLVRKGLGLVSLAFAVYLGSGFQYDKNTNTFKSLTLLSGLAPPVGYSWIHPNDCPQNLDCFKDLNKGVAYAKKENKPILIDFTGHACVNCRKMEEHVWPEDEILPRLKNDYVLISLYVDEKIELPKDEQITVTHYDGSMRQLKTYGDKWSHFQTTRFVNNSQPLYALISPDGKLLNPPVGYTPDAQDYAQFLDCGLQGWETLTGKSSVGMK